MAKFIELELTNGTKAYFNIDRIDLIFESKGEAVIVQNNEYSYTKETYLTVTTRINYIIKS